VQPQTDAEVLPGHDIAAILRALSEIHGGTDPLNVRVEAGYAMPEIADDDRTKPIRYFVFRTTEIAPEPQPTEPASASDVLAAFLKSVYQLASESKINKGITVIFKHVDSMLRRGGDGFEYVDRLLRSVVISRLQPELLLAFLAITYPAKPKLDLKQAYLN
jgi:hypothetical protein